MKKSQPIALKPKQKEPKSIPEPFVSPLPKPQPIPFVPQNPTFNPLLPSPQKFDPQTLPDKSKKINKPKPKQHPQLQPKPLITLLGTQDQAYMKAKTAAIIVSIHNGQSYDQLFTETQQKSEEGTKTMVFAAAGSAVGLLLDGFQGKCEDETVKLLFKEMSLLEPDCVVFNWECSEGYSANRFPEGSAKVMQLVGKILKGQHMAMFSDYSLKALIACWDVSILGPNPFRKMYKQFDGEMCLRFDPNTLKQSPSAQLQSVGDLSEGGQCDIVCLPHTIIYSIDTKNTDHNKYRLQVLTVAQNAAVDAPAFLLHINAFKGAAGHILLTYPNSGKILTSMGHWVELVKVDTSEQKLFQMAKKQYGESEIYNIESEMKGAVDKKKYISDKARSYVQKSAPCNNFAQKAKYNQYKQKNS